LLDSLLQEIQGIGKEEKGGVRGAARPRGGARGEAGDRGAAGEENRAPEAILRMKPDQSKPAAVDVAVAVVELTAANQQENNRNHREIMRTRSGGPSTSGSSRGAPQRQSC